MIDIVNVFDRYVFDLRIPNIRNSRNLIIVVINTKYTTESNLDIQDPKNLSTSLVFECIFPAPIAFNARE